MRNFASRKFRLRNQKPRKSSSKCTPFPCRYAFDYYIVGAFSDGFSVPRYCNVAGHIPCWVRHLSNIFLTLETECWWPSRKPGVVPCSDMSGEVIAVGQEVKTWKKGDRVCSNFSTDHIFGDTNPQIIQTSLGGQSPGVLTQYRCFPAHVGFWLDLFLCLCVEIVLIRHSWLFPSIFHTKKHRPSRKLNDLHDKRAGTYSDLVDALR